MRRWISPLAAAGLSAALLIPTTAHAQFGGLLKKAKKAVSGDSSSGAATGKPSSAFGPELNAHTFAAVMKGLNAELPLKQKHDAVVRQISDAQTARTRLLHSRQPEWNAYQKATSDHERCASAAWQEVDRNRDAAMQKKQQEMMSSPGGMQKMQQDALELTQQMAALMQKGDTAAAQRLQIEFARKSLGLDPKNDTIAVEKQCGKVPAKPAWLVQADGLYARVDTLNHQVADLESTTSTRGVQASGMSAVDYNLARERIVNWYYGGDSHTKYQQFGADERKMLEAHQADIKRVAEVL